MKVSVDPDKCMGHGMCTALAPAVYQVNEESGFNEMGEFEVADDQHAEARRGVTACPEHAIAVLSESV